MSAIPAEDRFSLLLLEDGEYYFKDYTSVYHAGTKVKIMGQLKICSMSVFFVPWNTNEPIFRIPFAKTTTVERVEKRKSDNDRAEGKNQFFIEATMRVDMKYGNRNVPYIKSTGEFSFLFSLIYTSLTTVLPRLKELFRIFKLPEEQRTLEIGKIIADHEQSESFNPGWLESEDEVIQYQVL